MKLDRYGALMWCYENLPLWGWDNEVPEGWKFVSYQDGGIHLERPGFKSITYEDWLFGSEAPVPQVKPPKIIQLIVAPNSGVMWALGDNGVTYAKGADNNWVEMVEALV
jgi:hypothetical protein